ncbi:recombination mediator RecR [Cryomorphaceae bacterium 1068]|nr:recombination mediator RecR [Cryomorphaceae bacterium 1068]
MISSKYIENAVNEIASLQGVGKRTALRYVLDLAGRSDEDIARFIRSIQDLKDHVKPCKSCHNLSDTDICNICSNPSRDQSIICVVEDIRDVIAIEATHQYKGLYHVLGGKISPMDGIGPSDLNVGTLLERVDHEEVKELILALSATMEGDTTSYYVYKKLEKNDHLVTSTLSRGVPVGDELQYTDEVTLGRSIVQRTPYDKSLQ